MLSCLQVYMELSEFEDSKTCLKRVLKLMKSFSASREEEESVETQLKVGGCGLGVW